ncbi:peptidoglycan DD-metalloendopeptidase family protein [Dongia deserti]|uniref:peptidoglycan DD-metalloendopeptidase family protein n=1 Tax=Dongia deserti TaxID=2268030 RepID=UPI000E65D48E|nr:peptidoglycan DD-metalloendopeptidase family protein [Dongia deserti]
MGERLPLRGVFAVALAAVMLAGCNLDTMLAAPPAPDPAVPADSPFGEVRNGQYVVAPGDTVAIVSERTNTPIRTLIDLNRLNPPYALKAGQLLSLQPRGSYVVQKGDTVSGIAARQGVSVSALVQLNKLGPPYTLQIGQALVLPTSVDAPGTVASAPQPVALPGGQQPKPFVPQGAAAVPTQSGNVAATPQPGGITSGGLPPLQGAAQPAPAQATPAPVQSAAPTPKPFEPSAPTQTAQIEPPPAAKTVPSGDPLPTLRPDSPFIWPVDGKVISRFGPANDNLRNDGINIAAPVGAPVKASAAGVVAYAGNELRGFGNMVLLRHEDGWVTAYAHNSSLLVQKGEKVGQGQTIARVGSSGNVDTPQLHFELRQGTKAVDPLKVLTR